MIRESKYAIFNFELCDENLINELMKYLDSNAYKIFQFFDVEIPSKKVPINIIPTKREFDKTFKKDWGYDCEDWGVGYSKNLTITYLSLNDFKNTKHSLLNVKYYDAIDYYKKTLLHEFVHSVNELFKIKNNCGYTVKYLREGIATYLSGQKENISISFDYTIEQLLETDSSKSCYDGYYLITKYLLENYDKSLIMDLFKSNRKATEFLKTELYKKAKTYYDSKTTNFTLSSIT